jgi:hypothetical protein
MPARRYNCGCGKKRYRDERSALAAAAADQDSYGDVVTVYRCPGGLAWHLTSHGFTPEALRSIGRRLAFEVLKNGQVDLEDFGIRALRLDRRPDPRRRQRLHRCAEQMTELGLTQPAADADADASDADADAGGRLVAVNRAGLARVVQIGLDAYAEECA